jgi:hypothetical protein
VRNRKAITINPRQFRNLATLRRSQGEAVKRWVWFNRKWSSGGTVFGPEWSRVSPELLPALKPLLDEGTARLATAEEAAQLTTKADPPKPVATPTETTPLDSSSAVINGGYF